MNVVPRHPPEASESFAGGVAGAGADETVMLRTYKAWKGSNVFLCGGRFIFGPDSRSILLTIFLITAPVSVFCVFVARKLLDDFPDERGISIMAIAIALTFLDLIFLVLTSGRDPGIVPRNAHPPEPEDFERSTDTGANQTPMLRLPRVKEVIVNGIPVKIKYCDTCMLYRPPRCSHCSICNNCVEKFDHHCPWVGQCIGLRNYRFFFMFISCATILCLYVHVVCWIYIRRIMFSEEDISIWKAMIKTPASIALIVYTFIAFWFVGGLTFFHLYLIGTNQSTYENFRYRYERRVNPFNQGLFYNFFEVFCSRIPPSKNDFRKKVPNPSVQPHVVGGGFVSSLMGKAIGDLEMGRKPVWDATQRHSSDYDGPVGNDYGPYKDADLSSDLSGNVYVATEAERQDASHSRRSSWGRRSRSLNMSPDILSLADVGASRRATDTRDINIPKDTEQSQTSSSIT